MTETFGCQQVITKVTTNYGSMLDLVFLKVFSDAQVHTDVLETYWSDHKRVYAAVDLDN